MASFAAAGSCAILLLAVLISYTDAQARNAICVLKPDPNTNLNIVGTVKFYQSSPNALIHITVDVSGLRTISPDDEHRHGFHVHEHGDVSTGCTAAGGHYNPFHVNHGGPTDTIRHPGDFGNLRQNCNGTLVASFTDPLANLFGEHSIIGRSIVLHAGVDDLGRGGNPASLANGNAGPRLACCLIEFTSG